MFFFFPKLTTPLDSKTKSTTKPTIEEKNQIPPMNSDLSVTPGRMKNIQKWMPNTSTTWNTHFPSRVFFR